MSKCKYYPLLENWKQFKLPEWVEDCTGLHLVIVQSDIVSQALLDCY